MGSWNVTSASGSCPEPCTARHTAEVRCRDTARVTVRNGVRCRANGHHQFHEHFWWDLHSNVLWWTIPTTLLRPTENPSSRH